MAIFTALLLSDEEDATIFTGTRSPRLELRSLMEGKDPVGVNEESERTGRKMKKYYYLWDRLYHIHGGCGTRVCCARMLRR